MESIIENIKRQLKEDKDLTVERKIELVEILAKLEYKQRYDNLDLYKAVCNLNNRFEDKQKFSSRY